MAAAEVAATVVAVAVATKIADVPAVTIANQGGKKESEPPADRGPHAVSPRGVVDAGG